MNVDRPLALLIHLPQVADPELFQPVLVLAATVASGLVLVVKPESVSGLTGLAPDAARGVTEIRAAMGGVFIALGLAVLPMSLVDR